MVSAIRVDALTNPSEVIRSLYKQSDTHEAFSQQVAAHFSSVFASKDAFDEISVLDVNHPPETFRSRSLVRFDCMVQDTACPPEIYLAECPNGDCGGWGLHSSEQDEDSHQDAVDYSLLQECGVVWATSIPGLSPWLSGDNRELREEGATKSALTYKFPLTSGAHIAAQIKVYDSKLTEALRTTDLYSFVGILSFEPRSTSLESSTLIPVPTIHVVFARPIPSTIIPRAFPDQSLLPNIEDVRAKLVSWIADEALGGDRLAAELVLLTVVHKVQSRTPPVLPLSITLSGFEHASDVASPKLARVLSQLVPMCTVIPLSLETINNTNFFPQSKEEDLHSGWLQLPKGSVCLVSELPLNEGTVSERGLLNLKQVQETISHQTLAYAFPFSQYSFETDLSFIVLAAGKRSAFFTSHLLVPIQPGVAKIHTDSDSGGAATQIELPSPELLNQFRQLIGGAKVASVGLDSSTAAFIQEDFVKERQTGDKGDGKVTSDDLILRMMLAKALAASLHSAEVRVDMWERVKELEKERQARVQTLPLEGAQR